MSRPRPHGNGAYDARAANQADAPGARPDGEVPSIRPIVYQPQEASAPPYDEFADPAAAHGWMNAYDETRELPPLTDADGLSRADRRAHRRHQGAERRWRVMVVAGALGIVAAAVLIGGFSFGGASSDGPRGGDVRTGPAAGKSAATRPDATTHPDAATHLDAATPTPPLAPAGTEDAPGATASTGDSANRTPSPPPSPEPSRPAPSTTPTPTATTSAAADPGAGRGNGHGRGGGKTR